MDRDADRSRSVTRRALMLGGIQVGLLGALVGRMYHLQVTESERYLVLADENRINMRLIPPSRGRILDRFGVPLAVNNQNFRAIIVKEQARNVAGTLGRLAEIIPITEADLERVLHDLDRRLSFVPVTVRENLTWDQVSQIEVNTPELPGVSIEMGEIRQYPAGPSTAHVLGYVGAVTEDELRAGDPVLALPGFRIGKNGLEREHDLLLRGTAGRSRVEVNAIGRVIRELDRQEGQPGEDVQSTIDIELQAYAQERLATEYSASAVVMDVENGEVFVMASHPAFDPNLFTTAIDRESWANLSTDLYAPLTNKALTGAYAPGSTFKMVVALAALEAGVIPLDHRVHCPGHFTLGDTRFHCWRRWGHGRMDVVSAIEESCDVFFYEVSQRVGVDRIAAMSNRLGLGVPLGIDLPGERTGLIPTRDWYAREMGRSWQPGDTVVASIGQGFVLTTPLQLAVMTARLASGRAVVPHLTYRTGAPGTPPLVWDAPDLGLPERPMRLVRDGMVAVTTGSRGTARSVQIAEQGWAMAGKTGTSQVRRITAAERATGVIANADLPWRQRDHALFVGYAPLHAPRYACSVVVEHGGGGSGVAAPIARDLLRETQRRDPARRPVGETAAAGPSRPSGG